MIVYAALLSVGLGTLLYCLATRTPLIMDVIRDRNALYREVHGDHIENAYTLRLINLDEKPHIYQLQVSGLSQLEVVAPTAPLEVAPGTVSTISARLQAPDTVAAGVHAITLRLVAIDAPRISVSEQTRFIGPQS